MKTMAAVSPNILGVERVMKVGWPHIKSSHFTNKNIKIMSWFIYHCMRSARG